MLWTLCNYVLRELGKSLGLSLLVYTVLMLGITSGQVIREGASIFTTLSILPMLFPLISPLVLPLSIVTGVLICYGRMASANEHITTQASGIHPAWLAAPALAVGLTASLITVYLNANVLTLSVRHAERTLWQDSTAIMQRRLSRPGSMAIDLRDGKMLALTRLPRSWVEGIDAGIDATQFRQGKKSDFWDPRYPMPEEAISASGHELSLLREGERLIINAHLKRGTRYDVRDPDNNHNKVSANDSDIRYYLPEGDNPFSLTGDRLQYWGIDRLIRERAPLLREVEELRDAFRANLKEVSDRWLPEAEAILRRTDAPSLDEGLAARREALAKATSGLRRAQAGNRSIAGALHHHQALFAMEDALRAFGPATIAGEAPVMAELKRDGYTIANKYESYNKRTAELHFKLTVSFACIGFALIGVPFGLMAKRGSAVIGFATGFGLAVIFYLVTLSMQTAVKEGNAPWYMLWGPNLLLLGSGVVLWWRQLKAR